LASRVAIRPLLAGVPAAHACIYAWSLLEDPVSRGAFVSTGVLACIPALAGRTLDRVVLATGAALATLAIAFETWPHTALDRAWTALHDAPAVQSPFDPSAYPSIHGLVVALAFALALVAALAAASGRSAFVAAAVAVGIGFPAVLLEDTHAITLGVIALAAVLWCGIVQSAREVRRASLVLVVAVVVVAASGGLAGAVLAPSEAHLDWRGWDPFAGSGRATNLRYVWDATYAGIDFRLRSTVVLRIRAPKRAEYWRVSTLDTFTADRWIENLYPVAIDGPRRGLPPDPLVPRRDARPNAWLRQVVTIVGLDDARVVAAGQPARIDGPSLGRLSYLSGGVMQARRPLRRDSEYTVWSYVPRPTPRALASAPPRYPADAARYLELGRARFPGFGASERDAKVDVVFTDERYRALWPYRALWQNARRVTAKARSSYEATLLLERWFRRDGGFRYEEHPPGAGNPPLVDFVVVNRAGYCQHYAGAMAVMLRLLGIPARVAVGFTSGTWKGGVWTVTDHQAHAWVEAWFAGYGWMTFDPTPGRGTLSVVYTLASDSADAIRALGTGRFLDFTPQPPTPGDAVAPVSPAPPGDRTFPWWLLVVGGAPFVAASAVVVAKRLRRAWRLRGGDARRIAAAVRAELVSALVDRGAAVPPNATTAALRAAAERVLRMPLGALAQAIAESRFGPPARAAAAASVARAELAHALDAAAARERPAERLRALLSIRSFRPGLTASARSKR
jgi:transglutaminase-like putative cysteine protease